MSYLVRTLDPYTVADDGSFDTHDEALADQQRRVSAGHSVVTIQTVGADGVVTLEWA